jgi:hypothetical protein
MVTGLPADGLPNRATGVGVRMCLWRMPQAPPRDQNGRILRKASHDIGEKLEARMMD